MIACWVFPCALSVVRSVRRSDTRVNIVLRAGDVVLNFVQEVWTSLGITYGSVGLFAL